MKKQTSLIVSPESNYALNELLENGWSVVSATAFHLDNGGASFPSAKIAPILVILEKN